MSLRTIVTRWRGALRGRRSAHVSRRAAHPTSTLEEQASAYLAARRAAALARAEARRLEPGLLALLRAEHRRGVSVAGLGRVSIVERGAGERLDQRAAAAALRAAGLPVPTIAIHPATYLRTNLDRLP